MVNEPKTTSKYLAFPNPKISDGVNIRSGISAGSPSLGINKWSNHSAIGIVDEAEL